MSTPQPLNDPISVEASLKGDRLQPQAITWRGQTHRVTAVGRQWSEGDNTHVLVELHDGSRMEIALGTNLTWHARRFWPATTAV
jgi:hypothetical protein